jgi:hypothetical protein
MDKFVIGMLKMDTKEIIQHSLIPSACLVNAMRISRNDMTPLLAMTKINIRTQMQMQRNLQGLLTEMAVRQSTLSLFKSFQKSN